MQILISEDEIPGGGAMYPTHFLRESILGLAGNVLIGDAVLRVGGGVKKNSSIGVVPSSDFEASEYYQGTTSVRLMRVGTVVQSSSATSSTRSCSTPRSPQALRGMKRLLEAKGVDAAGAQGAGDSDDVETSSDALLEAETAARARQAKRPEASLVGVRRLPRT